MRRKQLNYRTSNLQKHREAMSLQQSNNDESIKPASVMTVTFAGFYVLSGVTQPLLMSIAKEAGLADPTCQLYMLFYYMGPASVIFPLLSRKQEWPSRRAIGRAACIAGFDLTAQALNYTGSAMAGPTIFAIIYSSVTVWTAVFSRCLLNQALSTWQWIGVATVFGGLAITGFDTVSMGQEVFHGSCLVTVGSIMHALTYVMSESVMTKGEETLSVQANCAIQGLVSCSALLVWQLVYTLPRFDALVLQPMEANHTTAVEALTIFLSFTVANLVHALSFFHTLKHFWGGSTSAGVMKALQAVLVFVLTSIVFCGRLGGAEMCFSHVKFVSLVTVVGGVVVFGKATEQAHTRTGYTRIEHRDESVLQSSI